MKAFQAPLTELKDFEDLSEQLCTLQDWLWFPDVLMQVNHI